MKWYDRVLIGIVALLLISISQQLTRLCGLLNAQNAEQNRYSNMSVEYAKIISASITRTQAEIARIDDRWEKQRQAEAELKKQVELFELQRRKMQRE